MVPLAQLIFQIEIPNQRSNLLILHILGHIKEDLIPSFIDHIVNKRISPIVNKHEVLNSMAVSLAIEESLSLGRQGCSISFMD